MTHPDTHTNSQSSSRHAYWAAWLSLACAAEGMILICMGDPLWLGLPSSAVGALMGGYALRRGQENHIGAHLGLNFGLFNLFLWLLLFILMQYVFKMDPMSLFEIPSYD